MDNFVISRSTSKLINLQLLQQKRLAFHICLVSWKKSWLHLNQSEIEQCPRIHDGRLRAKQFYEKVCENSILEHSKKQINCWDQNSMKHLPSPYVLLGDIGLKIYQHFDKVESISLDQNSQHISARVIKKAGNFYIYRLFWKWVCIHFIYRNNVGWRSMGK